MPTILDIYSSAIYEIYEPNFIFQVGKASNSLNTLLNHLGAHEWAFITAYNPYPETLTDEVNLARLCELQLMVSKFQTYSGEGRGNEDHPCNPERSLLIMGISRVEAEKIGNYFGQKAILAGDRGGPVELVVLFD